MIPPPTHEKTTSIPLFEVLSVNEISYQIQKLSSKKETNKSN